MIIRTQPDPLADGRAMQPRYSQSVAALLRRLVRELAALLRQEFALASAELTHGLRTLAVAAVVAMAGGIVLFSGILMLLSSAVLGLSHVVAPWLAALLIGCLVSLVGIVALLVGIRGLQPRSLKPRRIARSLARDTAVLMRRAP